MEDSGSILPEERRVIDQDDRAFRRLVRSVALTQESEIDCTTCLEQVPLYVDRELAGADVAEEMPELQLHLVQCGDCFEEYEALRDLVALDSSNGLPTSAPLLNHDGA